MDVRILGPFEVREDGRGLDLGGPRPRALLAVLVLRGGEVVPSERLVDELWGERPPRSANHLLHVYVSSLRKHIGARLITRTPGYLLELEGDELDAGRFERLLGEGRRLLARGDFEGASATLGESLGLWRGPALADFAYEPFAQAEIARLEELRFVAGEERIEADLALGRHAELVGELEALVAESPLRERPRAQLMLALYRSGRQAEALEAYRKTRRVLVEEIGIEPGSSLKALEQAILRHDASLELKATEPASTPTRATRKLVTVVVAGWTDSGELEGLDPEARRRLVARAEEAATAVLTRHGATVERFPDERVMGVLGVPAAHDGDALAAVRAAAELRKLDGVRIGVETGEVVVEGRSISGDAVTRAFRLNEKADPETVLLGATTYRLVRHAVLAEFDSEQGAMHLVAVLPDASSFPRRLDSPFVGRMVELEQLRASFEKAVHDRGFRLVTMIGDPGIGKSRLAQELVAGISGRANHVFARCVPSGEGLTYWPLKEVVRQAAGAETREALLAFLRDEPEREAIVAGVTAAIGTVEPARAREESYWAFRKLFEAWARERPLLLVLEDVHLGEPTFLELVEYLADWADAPILALCLARPELLEARPDWPATMLEPVSREDADALLGRLLGNADLPAEVRTRIVDAAGGNPLFLEQLVATLADEERSPDEIALPASIRAVLAARLDRLGPGERAVLERAAVAGREVQRDAVAALLPEDAHASLDRHLQALERKDYLRAGELTFRFNHALVQEAAYSAVPKMLRAELHERLGDWLEEAGQDEEVVGYHLERAFRFRDDLQVVDWHARRLAVRAAERLGAAGRRALARDDPRSAVNLLDRAVSLLPKHEPRRLHVLPDLVEALRELPDIVRASTLARAAIDGASDAGERGVEALAQIEYAYVRLMSNREGAVRDALDAGERGVEVFGELGDHGGLARAWRLVAVAHRFRGRQSDRRDALEQALVHVRRTGDRRMEAWIYDGLGGVHNYGPSSVAELLRFAEHSIAWARANARRFSEAHGLAQGLGRSYAMLGDFGPARRAVAEAKAIVEDLGFVWHRAGVASAAGFVEMLAGDYAAAEQELRVGYELVEQAGMTGSYYGMALREELAGALYAQGRFEDAKELSEASERDAAPDDIQTQVLWRAIRAKVLANEGRVEEAESFARAAVGLVEQTEFVIVHANALMDLAEVLRLAGRSDAAIPVAQEACDLYRRKGDRVSAKRARAVLAELSERSSLAQNRSGGAQRPPERASPRL